MAECLIGLISRPVSRPDLTGRGLVSVLFLQCLGLKGQMYTYKGIGDKLCAESLFLNIYGTDLFPQRGKRMVSSCFFAMVSVIP